MFGQPSLFAVLDVEPTATNHDPKRLIKEYPLNHEPTATNHGPKGHIKEYLLNHEPEFARLNSIQVKGWGNKSLDKYFQRRHQRAITPDLSYNERFYKMSQETAAEMNDDTGALSFDKASTPQVLDLCMAPGGYSATILHLNPTASIDGITLPPGDGGDQVLIPYGSADSRVCVVFTDITMLATEYGVDMKEVPTDHPDVQKLTSLRPYQDKRYDLVLCDGLVLHRKMWHSYRKKCEATRLTNAQLILGLQRIKPGGTLIILLHKLNTYHSMMLVRSFCAFATVELFKPKRSDALRSSFYMVAKDVQPHCAEAEIALTRYKSFWYKATFRHVAGSGETADRDDEREDVKVVLEEFGPKLGELGRRIWPIRADALEKLNQRGPK